MGCMSLDSKYIAYDQTYKDSSRRGLVIRCKGEVSPVYISECDKSVYVWFKLIVLSSELLNENYHEKSCTSIYL